MLVDLQNISKKYAHQDILKDVNFSVKKGEKIAIIGNNGSGKSTLLKIIQNIVKPDSGVRIAAKDIEIASLDQDFSLDENLSVKEALNLGLKKILNAKKELEKISIELNKTPNDKLLLKEYERLSLFLDEHLAWDLEARSDRILREFELKEHEEKKIFLLSGGEKRRLMIACVLLSKPDLLLLDEPTNHLDSFMTNFVEKMIKKENYTTVFISHDRHFIDSLSDFSVEIDNAKLTKFQGGYSDYLAQKALILENMQKTHEQNLKLLRSEIEWLSKGVKARVKRNMGRKKRIDELKQAVKTDPSAIRQVENLLFKENLKSTEDKNKQKILVQIKDVSIKFGEKTLFENFSAIVKSGEKIALVGKNGSGKSSLLECLNLGLNPSSGEIKIADISVGYLRQTNSLDDNKNLVETFCAKGSNMVQVDGKNIHVYAYVKSWGLKKEFLDKKIGVLSGGEKTRVALALFFTKNYDLFILDEPTNHLDISTINILEQRLIELNKCVIFVSHDRYFVDKIARRIWYIWQNKITNFVCSFEEILENMQDLEDLQEASLDATKQKNKKEKTSQKLSYKESVLLKELPAQIETKEKALKTLQDLLENPQKSQNKSIQEIAKEFEQTKLELENLIDNYLILDEKQALLNAQD